MGLGLIGAAMAGGLAGGGEAARQSMARMQETESQKELEEMRNRLALARETALANLRQGFEVSNINLRHELGERSAESAEDRRRRGVIWGSTGEGGAATREAAAIADREEHERLTNPERVKADAARTAAIEGAKPVTLSVGQRRVGGDGKTIADNNSDAYLRVLSERGRGGGGGSGGGGVKLDPLLKEEWDTLEKREASVNRMLADLEKRSASVEDKLFGPDSLKTGAERDRELAEYNRRNEERRNALLQERAEIEIGRRRIFFKAGKLDPKAEAQEELRVAKSPEEIDRSIRQAYQIDPRFGKTFEEVVAPARDRMAAERRDRTERTRRAEDRGFVPGGAGVVRGAQAEEPPRRNRMGQTINSMIKKDDE